jgi:polysaccharide deacetylase 2 family uncharacterized protein YibQ
MARRRSRSRSTGRSGTWLFLLGLLVGAGVLYLAFRERSASLPRPGAPAARPERALQGEDRESSSGDRPAASSSSTAPRNAEGAAPAQGEPAAAEPGRVALVIDDLGRSVEELDAIERLGVPVSYAVLPFEEQTSEVVAALRRRHAEILLHLPMEPVNGEDPGPGALYLGMGEDELREKTEAALGAVPGAVGVNNHMGSGLSADEPSMEAILRVLAARRLFYLDSRTSAETVGYRMASKLGIPAAERQVFLDRDPTAAGIRVQFQRLLDLARTRGAAIAIGHPHPETLAILAEEVPKALEKGYEFVPVSYLLDRPDEPEEE